MRDTTECINSIGYALFAVIKAIFIKRNILEMIVMYPMSYKLVHAVVLSNDSLYVFVLIFSLIIL